MYLIRLLCVMTYVMCVQSQQLEDLASKEQEQVQPADEIVIKLNPGGTSEDLDKILRRHPQFVFSKEVA